MTNFGLSVPKLGLFLWENSGRDRNSSGLQTPNDCLILNRRAPGCMRVFALGELLIA
jgi:hypothetical protein